MRLLLLCFLVGVTKSQTHKTSYMDDLNIALEVSVPTFKGNVQKIAQGFGKVGKIVYEMANGTQNGENQEELKLKLVEISKKLSKMYDDVELLTENVTNLPAYHPFPLLVKAPVNRLDHYMQDVLTNPRKEKVKIFKSECTKINPTMKATNLAIMMTKDIISPFRVTMEMDDLKSNNTYQAWKLNTEYIMSTCARLAVMCYDLKRWDYLDIEETLDYIEERYNESISSIDRDAVISSETYWPNTVQKLINNTLYKNKHSSNQAVVNELKENLGEICTRDEFLILVYDDAPVSLVHSFANVDNQLLCVSDKGRRACVYRSKNASQYNVDNINVLQTEMQSFFHLKQIGNTQHHMLSKTSDQILTEMRNSTGMVAIISHEYHVAYDSTMNPTSGFPFGPGWILSSTVTREYFFGIFHQNTDVLFIAGLP